VRLGKRELRPIPIIAVVSVFLMSVSLVLIFRLEKEVKIYNKEFQVVDVEYNHATTLSGKRFKEKVMRLLARLGTPQKFLDKIREPQRTQVFSVRAFSFAPAPDPDTLRVYFRWPYSYTDLVHFYAELVDERGKMIPLLGHMKGTNPKRNEKDMMWDVPRGTTDSNSVYTLRIIRVDETNAVRLAEIKLGHLRN
jgi:hypothetical protein